MATILVAKLILKEQFLTKATILLEVWDFFCKFDIFIHQAKSFIFFLVSFVSRLSH